MSYTIIKKDVPPTLMLTHRGPCTFQNLSQTVYNMYTDVKKNLNGSFFCYTREIPFKPDTLVEIYCPVKSAYEEINDKKHEYKVKQRTKVLSTVYNGAYDELIEPLEAILGFAKGKEYEVILPYRVIFHKEKRKWQRNRFFRRAVGEYVVELQVEVAWDDSSDTDIS